MAPMDVVTCMGKVLDGVAPHIKGVSQQKSFKVCEDKEPDIDGVVSILKSSGADLLVNFLPVGSQKATEFYMEAALSAKIGVVNCIPVFIASDDKWAHRFETARIPILGDDIKSQMGATIIHRTLADLFKMRGVAMDCTYPTQQPANNF